MINYKFGNMFDGLNNTFMVIATGNSVVRQDGRLTMGAGSALCMKNTFPGVDYFFGRFISKHCNIDETGYVYYGFIPCERPITGYSNVGVGLLQTKYDWKGPAYIPLIKKSLVKLHNYITNYRPDLTYRLSFPGIHNGGLQAKEQELKEFMESLFTTCNLEIWKLNTNDFDSAKNSGFGKCVKENEK